MGLLDKMKFSIDSLSMGEKFLGSMVVTVLGMAIVFIGLAILYFSIIIMQKTLGRSKDEEILESKPRIEEVQEEMVDDKELVAVITAAIAASLHTSTHNIIVRNITRVSDPTPSWAKAGRVEQMNNRL